MWPHVQLSEQIRYWGTLVCCWDVKQASNQQTRKVITLCQPDVSTARRVQIWKISTLLAKCSCRSDLTIPTACSTTPVIVWREILYVHGPMSRQRCQTDVLRSACWGPICSKFAEVEMPANKLYDLIVCGHIKPWTQQTMDTSAMLQVVQRGGTSVVIRSDFRCWRSPFDFSSASFHEVACSIPWISHWGKTRPYAVFSYLFHHSGGHGAI